MINTRIPATERLSAQMSCAQAFCAIIADCLADFDAYLAEIMENNHPSGPHKARVALRRLTTAFDVFAPILRQKPLRKFRDEAKWIFRALGQLRDCDVISENMPSDQTLAQKALALRVDLRKALRKRGAIAYGPKVLAALSSGLLMKNNRVGRLAAQASVAHLATPVLAAHWSGLQQYGPDLARLSVKKLHDFRKDAKALRYSVEFFAPLWPQDQVKPYRRALQKLQDASGRLTDMAMLKNRGHGASATAEGEALKLAMEAWQALIAHPLYWAEHVDLPNDFSDDAG